MLWCDMCDNIIHVVTNFMIWYVHDMIWYVEGHVMCMIWHNTSYDMNDTVFNADICLKGYVVNWYDMKKDGKGWFMWDPTSDGEENETFFIRVWKTLTSRHVLKPWAEA